MTNLKTKEDDFLNTEVIVYTAPSCGGCIGTKNWLAKKGVEYTEIPVTEEIIKAKGLTAAPFIEIIEKSPSGGSLKDSWSGFRPDRLAGALL